MDKPRILTVHPNPAMARIERIFFPNGLTLEDRARMGVRAAKLEIVPEHIEALKKIPPEVKLASAFSMFDWAWEMMYLQGLERGLTSDGARRYAAEKMLKPNDD